MAVGKMAAEKCGVAHDVEKMQQILPLITRETAFCQNVCELILGFDVLHLNLRIQIYAVNYPIERNPVGAGHVSHRQASAFDYHLYHSFVIFENVQMRSQRDVRSKELDPRSIDPHSDPTLV